MGVFLLLKAIHTTNLIISFYLYICCRNLEIEFPLSLQAELPIFNTFRTPINSNGYIRHHYWRYDLVLVCKTNFAAIMEHRVICHGFPYASFRNGWRLSLGRPGNCHSITVYRTMLLGNELDTGHKRLKTKLQQTNINSININ